VTAQKAAFGAGQRRGAIAEDDPEHFPTHWGATLALLSVETFQGPIWEPACGDGALCEELARGGYEVVATTLHDYGYGDAGRDFLLEWQPLAPNVATNPPFAWAQEFIERALMLTRPPPGANATRKVAMLLRLAFLEGRERGRWFKELRAQGQGLARVWVMSARIPFTKGERAADDHKGGPLAFAWFVFEHGHTGPAVTDFLDWRDIATAHGRRVKNGRTGTRARRGGKAPDGPGLGLD
jgi:hypothetical protein